MSMPDNHPRIPGTEAKRVLVAGVTGRFGAIADLLLARGHAVRAATRDPAHPAAAALAARGAEIVRADFEDAGSLAAAGRGITWHSFGDWAFGQRGRLAEASGTAPAPGQPGGKRAAAPC